MWNWVKFDATKCVQTRLCDNKQEAGDVFNCYVIRTKSVKKVYWHGNKYTYEKAINHLLEKWGAMKYAY